MIVLPLLCRAQDASYIQYTTEDGLPTDYVYGVVEDEDGFIWAYTENGLAKFDGYEFEHFTVEDGLPGNDIPFAEKGPDGKIWIHSIYNRPAYLYQDSIYTIHDEGCIYTGLFDGEARFSCKTGEYAYKDTLTRIMHLEYDATLIKAYPQYFDPVEVAEQLDTNKAYQRIYTQDAEGKRKWYRTRSIKKIPGSPYYFSFDPNIFFTQRPGGQWRKLSLKPSLFPSYNYGQIPGKEQYLISDSKNGMYCL